MSFAEVVEGIVKPLIFVLLVGLEHAAVENMAEQLITGSIKRTGVVVITMTGSFSSHTQI